jgi:hypothetical protein
MPIRKHQVQIIGRAETYRTSRKAKAAIHEDFTAGEATVRISYPSHFGAEQIEAARLLAYPTARLSQKIRERFQRDKRDSAGVRRETGHTISGGMWASLKVRSLRNKVYAQFYGSSPVFRRVGTWEYPPQFTGAGGRWNKRDAKGRLLPAEKGEVKFVADPSGGIRRAPDRPVANKIKAQASTDADKRSILEYSEKEKTEFAEEVGAELLAYFRQALGID